MPTSISETLAGAHAGRETAKGAALLGLKDRLIREASALGFDAARITTPDSIKPAGDHLLEFIRLGRHGDMSWMETTAQRRKDPRALWPEVRSVIMLGVSYAPEHDPLDDLARPSNGAISVYAQGRDYHDILKAKLKRLGEFLAREAPCDVRVFVDTAPLMEKPLAHAAGIGWQGKHTNLVSRSAGSWLFLGAVLTDLALEADAPDVDHCGSCRRCLDICPTDAFPRPYQLDARRCIAYLTIEHKGHIAPEFRKPIGNRVFGCDDCLAVCPWNKFASSAHEGRFAARDEAQNPPLADLLGLDDATFRKRYAGTPIKRTGRDRFLRNVLIAAGNSGDRVLLPLILPLLADASALVRAMAVWALRQLGDTDTVAKARRIHLAREGDEAVRGEWLSEQTA
jgi:epoxyqueuosine reductase